MMENNEELSKEYPSQGKQKNTADKDEEKIIDDPVSPTPPHRHPATVIDDPVSPTPPRRHPATVIDDPIPPPPPPPPNN